MVVPDSIKQIATIIMQPHPIAFPNFRWRPDLVSGTPIFFDIFCFTFVTPRARFHENPPLLAIF